MNVDRFTDPLFLKQLGRPLLERFISRFASALDGRNLLLPPPGALDQEFFNLSAHLFMSPEGMPREMSEAIHDINEMASPEGQQRLEETISQSDTPLEFEPQSTRGDLAMQVWLADPALLARARNLHRLSRLSTFHHFGPAHAIATRPACLGDSSASLAALETECDLWFAKHNRGRHNTRIELYRLSENGSPGWREFWFLIHHGDTFARTPKVDRGRTEVLHFRPAKDDVVVYNARRNEIRINARTAGERNLYQAAFGQYLFEDPAFFSDRKTYTLAPLRREGLDALDTRGVRALDRVVLREYELAIPGPFGRRTIEKATDLFAAANSEELLPPIPSNGELTRATFDVHFTGAKLSRTVQLQPPNTLRLARHTDAQALEEWLSLRGFRVSAGDAFSEDSKSFQTVNSNQKD